MAILDSLGGLNVITKILVRGRQESEVEDVIMEEERERERNAIWLALKIEKGATSQG